MDLGLDNRDVDFFGDLTALPFPDSSVDLVIALHVLEHVPNDALAMSEIARVIGHRGLAILQVPWEPRQSTVEDPDASPAERKRRFGREDHVRKYGADFDVRLRGAGLQVAHFTASDDVDPEHAKAGHLYGRLWITSGVTTDPDTWPEMREVLLERRGSRPSQSVSIDPNRLTAQIERELRDVRWTLYRVRRALRQERIRHSETTESLEDTRALLKETRLSRSYVIGHRLLQPIRWIRRSFKKTWQKLG